MKGRWISYIAGRYLLTHNGKKGHLGNILAFLGLTIGIMTLITVMTVMNGFQQSFISSINEVYSYHIRIEDLPSEERLLQRPRDVTAAVRFRDAQGILSTDNSLSTGVSFRELDFYAAVTDKGFTDNMQLRDGRFPENRDEIILGQDLARFLAVLPGDRVSFSNLNRKSGSFSSTQYRVSGIFSTGFYEYDRNMVFSFLDDDPEAGITMGIKLRNHFHDRSALASLSNSYPDYKVQSWRVYNSAFFNALKIEKIFMFLIVALIFIVVAVNVYHSMKRNVKERLTELALLKSLGACSADLRRLYLQQGLFLGLCSSLCGTALGMILSLNVNEILAFVLALRNGFQNLLSQLPFYESGGSLPFYFSHIPVRIIGRDIIIINLCSLISVYTAAASAVRGADRVLPAEIFRNE